MLENKLGNVLEKLQAQSNLSWTVFSEICGVSRTYMYRMRGGTDIRSSKPVQPTINVLIGIADALKVSRTEFLQQCGYLSKSDIRRCCVRILHINRK